MFCLTSFYGMNEMNKLDNMNYMNNTHNMSLPTNLKLLIILPSSSKQRRIMAVTEKPKE
jgi:hypothetical protein